MKIEAKGRVSSNPYNQKIATTHTERNSIQIEEMLAKEAKVKSQGQNIKIATSNNAGLLPGLLQTATQQIGGATYPSAPDQFITVPVVKTNVKRLSNISYLGYSYSLDGEVTGVVGSSSGPFNLDAEIYLTIGVANQSFAYEFAQSGFTIDNKDKWVVWNSFFVGYLRYITSGGGVIAVRQNLLNDTKLAGSVDWINTIPERKAISSPGFGSGINFYDFSQNPDKITDQQFTDFVEGNITALKVAFGVRTDNLTTGRRNHLINDVLPVCSFSPALEFYSTAVIANFN